MLKVIDGDWGAAFGYKSVLGFVYHRAKGPADMQDEEYTFYVAGVEHNLNDYSLCVEGIKECYLVGVLHNISGPSVSTIGANYWHINGLEYSLEEYNRILKISP